jgi:magnesium-transporting ATPase (P-type)
LLERLSIPIRIVRHRDFLSECQTESSFFVVLETHNIALQGTLCVAGSALAVCVGMGDKTVFGRIASLASGDRPVRTSLETDIFRFVLIIAACAISIGVIIVSEYFSL